MADRGGCVIHDAIVPERPSMRPELVAQEPLDVRLALDQPAVWLEMVAPDAVAVRPETVAPGLLVAWPEVVLPELLAVQVT